MWREILAKQVNSKGDAQVAKELGIAKTTVYLVINNKYPASTENIKKKVMAIYGSGDKVNCPVLGPIEPDRCAENWQRAKKIGLKVGNPVTLRLYKTCLKCPLRRG